LYGCVAAAAASSSAARRKRTDNDGARDFGQAQSDTQVIRKVDETLAKL